MISSFELFGKEIPLYGIFYYLGIFVSAILAVCLCRKRKIERYDIVYSAVYAVLAGVFGAKLLFIAVTLKTILDAGLPFWVVLKGGFVFYGGLLGGALGLYIYAKQFRLKFLPFADIYAAVLPLGHAIGRIGCFFAGCCYGMPYDGPFSVTYTNTPGDTPLGVPLLPIQLIEAALLLLLFLVSFILLYRTERSGIVCIVYLFAYPALRFVIEFFRGDLGRGVSAGLSTSQWISLGLMTVSLGCCFLNLKRKSGDV